MKGLWKILWGLALVGVSLQGAFAQDSLVVMTHDSFSVSKKVVAAFEAEHSIRLRFLKAGDAGAVLNQAILSKGNPLGDILFGVDNSFLSRALNADIFLPYASPLLEKIPDRFKLDRQNRLLPVDYGDVCLNYDKGWFQSHKTDPPSGLSDLIRRQYKDLTVVENPATSSPGLAFLMATVARFGDPGYLDFWEKLRQNGVLVTEGWESAYWGEFSGASEGDRPIVVSYASSPVAEVHFSKKPLKQGPTAAVVADGTCFRQIEFVGILKGTKKEKLAQKLVDFMLSKPFQEDIPLQMFVFPVNPEARLPGVFEKHARIAKNPLTLSPEAIAHDREKWIREWTQTVLR